MAKSRRKKEEEDHEEPSLNLGSKKQYKKIAGLVLILFALLFFVSFISYLFTWHLDEASVSSMLVDEFNNEST